MNTLLFVFFVILLVYIQNLLSKLNNKFAGLILPVIIFISSINSFRNIMSIETNGESNLFLGIKVFIIINLFTLIFLVIYFKTKKSRKKVFEKIRTRK